MNIINHFHGVPKKIVCGPLHSASTTRLSGSTISIRDFTLLIQSVEASSTSPLIRITGARLPSISAMTSRSWLLTTCVSEPHSFQVCRYRRSPSLGAQAGAFHNLGFRHACSQPEQPLEPGKLRSDIHRLNLAGGKIHRSQLIQR